MRPGWPGMTSGWTRMTPRWPRMTTGWLTMTPVWPRMTPGWPRMNPGWPGWPQGDLGWPRMTQGWPRMTPGWPSIRPQGDHLLPNYDPLVNQEVPQGDWLTDRLTYHPIGWLTDWFADWWPNWITDTRGGAVDLWSCLIHNFQICYTYAWCIVYLQGRDQGARCTVRLLGCLDLWENMYVIFFYFFSTFSILIESFLAF